MANINEIKVGDTTYGFGANQLVSPAEMDGVPFDGGDSVVHFALCSTNASTAAKTASLGNDFVLSAGSRVSIKFTYANTATSPTLNINGTGAKAIMAFGSTAAGSGAWSAGEVVSFVYDGTNWQMVNGGIAGTSNYGRVKLDSTPASGSANALTSGAAYTALAAKAPLASPTLTGTPKAPTAATGTDTTQIATTAFVNASINKSVEDYALKAFPTETSEGALASTSVGADNILLKQLLVPIVAIWDGMGDPSPENPENIREIHGWDGANIKHYYLAITDQPQDIYGVVGETVSFTVVAAGKGLSYQWQWYNGSAWYNTTASGNKTDTITLEVTEERYGYQYRCNVTDSAGRKLTSTAVKIASTAGDVRPKADPTYSGAEYVISFGQTVYGGELDVLTGLLTVTIWGHIFSGTESFGWYIDDQEEPNYHKALTYSTTTAYKGLSQGAQTDKIPYSSHYVVGSGSSVQGIPHINMSSNGTTIYFGEVNDADDGKIDKDAFLAYLSSQYSASTPVTVAWRLATPIVIQLSALAVKSYLGENYIEADTGDVDAVYRCDPTLYIDEKVQALTALISES